MSQDTGSGASLCRTFLQLEFVEQLQLIISNSFSGAGGISVIIGYIPSSVIFYSQSVCGLQDLVSYPQLHLHIVHT